MRLLVVLIVAALAATSTPASAAIFGRGAKAAAPSEASISQIRQAIDEARYYDAAILLDQALIAGIDDPRLTLLGADLNLARGRLGPALMSYQSVESSPVVQAQAYQGQGVVLSMTGKSNEAFVMLQKAVASDPTAWRAWNALGSEYDRRGQWVEAEAAYERASAASGGAAVVLNNRGYSRLLQHRPQEAVADFVAALQKRPDFPEARTNLRLAMAMSGDYERSVAGGSADDQAMLLNNAGFAAGARGDYATAQSLLDRAVASKGEFYERASENLKVVRALAAQDQAAPLARP